MIRMIFVYLPLAVLILGWLFGQIRVKHTAIFFLLWMVSCFGLFFVSMAKMFEPSGLLWLAATVSATVIAIPVSILFGAIFSKPVTPAPAKLAVDATIAVAGKVKGAYDDLDEDKKRKVSAAAMLGVKVGLTSFADYLRRGGHSSVARMVRTGARLI